MKTYLKKLKETFLAFLCALMNDEEKITNTEWYFYIKKEILEQVKTLYENGAIEYPTEDIFNENTFQVNLDLTNLKCQIKAITNFPFKNKDYNQLCKSFGKGFAEGYVKEKYIK